MPHPRSSKVPAFPSAAPPLEPDPDRAVDLVLRLLELPGPSGEEGPVAAFVQQRLLKAGLPPEAIRSDTVYRRSPFGGSTGNLILRLPGTRRGPRRMLSAHLDTVPICIGAAPVRRGDLVRPRAATTGLGGDNRAGVAVLLNTVLELVRGNLPHPPLTFCWFVQEEVGLIGSRLVQSAALGQPRWAYNFDGGSAAKLTIGATGGYRMVIDIRGLASHAGLAPEWGVSAIAIAALAIADLQRHGWHGLVRKGRHVGTSNVGVIQGGFATNVVTDAVQVRAEARSHEAAFRRRIVAEIEAAFQRAAESVRNPAGVCGKIDFHGTLQYESFRLAEDEPCVAAAKAAVRSLGREPELAVSNGGLDANWITAHGIPTVSLGCGQMNVHTTSEALDLAEFRDACRAALRLATAGEDGS